MENEFQIIHKHTITIYEDHNKKWKFTEWRPFIIIHLTNKNLEELSKEKNNIFNDLLEKIIS